jgi:hypothetical protein
LVKPARNTHASLNEALVFIPGDASHSGNCDGKTNAAWGDKSQATDNAIKCTNSFIVDDNSRGFGEHEAVNCDLFENNCAKAILVLATTLELVEDVIEMFESRLISHATLILRSWLSVASAP